MAATRVFVCVCVCARVEMCMCVFQSIARDDIFVHVAAMRVRTHVAFAPSVAPSIFPFLVPLNIHSAGVMCPAATAVADEHVANCAVHLDRTSSAPSTTGTVAPRIPNVALFCDPDSLW